MQEQITNMLIDFLLMGAMGSFTVTCGMLLATIHEMVSPRKEKSRP